MAPRIRNRHIGRFTLSVGLRRDGGFTFDVGSDFRDGGPVVVHVTTPWVIFVIFDQPTLKALADQWEAEEAAA
jgi:hypothetical protein